MNLEPQKFFVGLIDFFSVLLPGALLTYFIKDDVGLFLPGGKFPELAGFEGAAVFLFFSYLLGHFVFLIGALLLDDLVYDKVRKATATMQIRELARGKDLSPRWARTLSHLFFKKEEDRALNLAIKIKEHYLGALMANSAVNTFQWGKARLTLAHPQAIATVQRFEADSKFFRSLLVVLFILLVWGFFSDWPWITLAALPVLGVAALWRYAEQRLKSTNQVYWYIITLESQQSDGFRQSPVEQPEGITHAGGVVFRRVGDQVEYLLVQGRHKRQNWVLPKGHIKKGEQMRETAVREVREESGVWARILVDLKDVSYFVKDDCIHIQYYLMEKLEEGKSHEKRKVMWLPLDQATKTVSHPESRELISMADEILSASGN